MRSVPSALLAPHGSPKGLWAFKIIPVGIGQRSSDRLEIHAYSIIRANLIKLGLSVMRRPLHDSFFLFVTTVSHHFTRLYFISLYITLYILQGSEHNNWELDGTREPCLSS